MRGSRNAGRARRFVPRRGRWMPTHDELAQFLLPLYRQQDILLIDRDRIGLGRVGARLKAGGGRFVLAECGAVLDSDGVAPHADLRRVTPGLPRLDVELPAVPR